MDIIFSAMHRSWAWICSWFKRRPVDPVDPLRMRAAVLVQEQEPLQASGEYKRHQVYARLLKEFPDRRKRDVAFMIELVLQDGHRYSSKA